MPPHPAPRSSSRPASLRRALVALSITSVLVLLLFTIARPDLVEQLGSGLVDDSVVQDVVDALHNLLLATEGAAALAAAASAGMHASLSRQLCVVVTMGHDVDLDHLAQQLVAPYPNCLVHVASNDVAELPPPPPHAFVYQRFVLVSDSYDAVSGPATATPASNASTFPWLRPLTQEELTAVHPSRDKTVLPAADALLPYLLPRGPLRATSLFRSIDRNRVAAVVIRPTEQEDVEALLDVLKAFPPSHPNNAGFLESVFVEQCEAQLGNRLVDTLQGPRYGYVVVATASMKNACQYTSLWLASSSSAPATAAYPVYPTRYASSSIFGRLTNQIWTDSFVVQNIQQNVVPMTVGYVISEHNLHPGSGTLLYDLDWIYANIGPGLKNRLLSMADFVTIDNVGWCVDPSKPVSGQVMRLAGDNHAMHDITLAECLFYDNMIAFDSSMANNTNCTSRLPTYERSRRWDPPGTRSFVMSTGFNYTRCTRTPLKMTYTASDFTSKGTIVEGSRAFFSFNRLDLLGASFRKDAYEFAFGPIVQELADRQVAVYHRRLRAYWNLPESVRPTIVSVHMRLSDYDSKTNGSKWPDEIAKAIASAPGGPGVVHGLLICTDEPDNPKFRAALASHASIPKLDCVSDIAFDKSNFGFHVGVIQSVLAQGSCFVGIKDSTFARRIRVLRERQGYKGCEYNIYPQRRRRRGVVAAGEDDEGSEQSISHFLLE